MSKLRSVATMAVGEIMSYWCRIRINEQAFLRRAQALA